MQEDTINLEKELAKAKSIEEFQDRYKDSMIAKNVSGLLSELITSKNLKKSFIIKASNLSETYVYQIFSGLKKPSRDKLLALAIAMSLSLEECQQLLKKSGEAPLYAKNRRDAAIIFGIKEGLSVHEIDDLLYEQEEETLT